MQVFSQIYAVIGKLSLMAVALAFAVAVSQAVWVAVFVKGTRMVRSRQVLTLRDVLLGMKEDGVWVAYVLKQPLACFAGLTAAALLFRAGAHHPGWIALGLIAGFVCFGPILRKARRYAAQLTVIGALQLRKKSTT